ncbi:MAG: leucine-rich repeat protein [Verrucomicrobia bacterium]|nr:leucine-rich repeat protein [Verrucomicrobiota bacterium]
MTTIPSQQTASILKRLRLAGGPWLLPLLLLLFALPAAGQAQDYIYTVTNGKVTIIGYTGAGGAVSIPGAINGLPVVGIGDGAFSESSVLTSVTIPAGVTRIGNEAFSDCASLTSVAIPASVTSIGSGAFITCGSLTTIAVDAANSNYSSADGVLFDKLQTLVIQYPGGKGGPYTIPSGVSGIGDDAFAEGSALTHVTIAATVTSIGHSAFADCSGLISITVDAANPNFSSVDGVLFNKLKTTLIQYPAGKCGAYLIPASVTGIGDEAFYGCSGLLGVTILVSVISIGDEAFGECSGLTSVTIPASVTSIVGSPFFACSGLISITVDPANPNFSSTGGVLFNESQTTLIGYPAGKGGPYTIPGGVTCIVDGAFSDCAGLTGITIPTSVTSIGEEAFQRCSSLTSVTVPSGVISIGYQTFYDCTSLTNVTIPASVTNLGEQAFSCCTSLTSVMIPGSVTSIGDGAFYGCTSLKSITIPDSVTSLGYFVFQNCTGLTSATLGHGVTNLGGWAFENCGSLRSMVIPDGVTSIGSHAFYRCGSLTSVTFGNGLTSIGPHAFNSCTGLTQVTLPDSVTSIANHAFYNCGSLRGITLGNGVTSIGERVFGGCTSLTSVTLPGSVTSIGDSAFQGCFSLTSANIPAGVATIGQGTFQDCGSLDSITIPGSVTSRGDCAFYRCSSLREVTIPNSVTSLGNYVFQDCAGLTSVTLGNGITSIGGWLFDGCSKLPNITIPGSVTSVGNNAFYRCYSLEGILFLGNAPSLGSGVFADDYDTTVYHTAGATGWGTTFGDRPTELWNPQVPCAYTIDSGAVTITRYTGTGGDVIILGVINGLPVTRLEDEAFNGCASVTSVTLPASLTRIGDYVFEDCSGLVSITVNAASSSFSSLDGVLFDKLKTTLIQYPEGKAGTYTVPATITSIWAPAFYACRGLSAITVESGNPAFSSADGVLFDKLKSTLVRCPAGKAGTYAIPASVTRIGDGAFDHCASLTSITIPNGVTRIGDEAFETCPGLTGITIPASVTSIGANDAFGDCANLLAITVDVANSNFSSADGVLFDKLRTMLIQWPGGKAGSYTIPAGVTRLDDEAFASCAKLTNIIIPASVTNLGNGTFSECTGLTSVTIPSSVAAIGWEVFAGCTSLTGVTLPASLTSIGDEAFKDCPSLTAVYFDGSAPTLGWAVFAGDTKATAHYLPGAAGWAAWFGGLPTALLPFTYTADGGTITITGFTGSSAAVSLPGAINGLPVTRIGDEAFQGRASLTGVTLPTGITDIGSYAFQDTNLTGITIPDSVTRIGDGAFEWCHRLTSITLPASVTRIGEGEPAFIGCTNLSAITVDALNPAYSSVDGVLFNKDKTTLLQFPGGRGGSYPISNSVTSIGFGAFAGCPSLSAITVDDLNPLFSSVDGVLFDRGKTTLMACPGGKPGDYTIPTTVTNIENGAFCYCSNLSTITIPNTVTSIGFGTFAFCTRMTSVTIPTSVTSIGDSAFWNCTSLVNVAIPANVTTIGEESFGSCSKLTSITIPASVSSIGDEVFQHCTSLTSAAFMGSAPLMGSSVFDNTASGFKVYYFNGKAGFTSPTWMGYPAVNMGASTPLAIWLLANGFPYDTDLQSDPNGDGVCLLLAYALALDPKLDLSGCMPKPVIAGNLLSLTFYAGSAGVTYTVETSTDLHAWSTAGVTVAAPDASKFRTATVAMTAPRRFLRLAVIDRATLSPVAAWLLDNGFPADTNLQADPNGDGVNLLTAYALDLEPRRDLSGSMPEPVLAGNELSLTFHAGRADVTYAVEASSDLQSWSATGVILSAADASKFRTASVPMTGPRRFLRLALTPVPEPTDEQQIRDLFGEMISRAEAHDEAGFLALFAPDYLHQGMNLADGFDQPAFLDTIATSAFEITGITVTGNTARVAGLFSITFNNGEPAETWLEPDTAADGGHGGLGWLRKTPAGWRVMGDQKRATVSVQTAHSTTPGDERYYFQMRAESSLPLTRVSVCGPGIDTTELQPDLEWGGFNAFAGNFTSAGRPPVGTVYNFVVEFADGSRQTYQDSVKAWVVPGPVIAVTTGEGTATIHWSDVGADIPNPQSYWVRVVGGDVYWQSEDLPFTQTSIAFNADGTSTGTLVGGQSYRAWVFIFDTTDNYAFRTYDFTMPLPSVDFALIPAGSFQMGDTLDGDAALDPVHTVQVSAFYMAKHEVTTDLYNKVRTWGVAHGYPDFATFYGIGGTSYPVQDLTWFTMVKWCNARSEMEGLTPCYTVSGEVYRTGSSPPDCDWNAGGYRLPTEAEWEKAARGGLSGKRFPWGDTISHTLANFFNVGGETYQTGTTGYHPAYVWYTYPYTAPVGSFAANGYGLYDMAGNVAELCWDWFDGYPATLQTDPRGAASGTFRVVRGGYWSTDAQGCRVAGRGGYAPYNSYMYFGFRLARSAAP